MLKFVADRVVAFDVETIPRRKGGIIIGELPHDAREEVVFESLWKAAGATPENPQPFLHTHLVRVCSVAAVVRERVGEEVKLRLLSFPRDPENEVFRSELSILKGFFSLLETPRPQLVGYNSRGYEIPLLIRSGLALKLRLPQLFSRAQRRDGSVDYLDPYADWHIDLMNLISPFGVKPPSLNEIARICGIPGKMEVSGADVATMWLEQKYSDIVNYNEYDALSTYLLWLRCPLLAGLWTREEFELEEQRVKDLIRDNIASGKTHLQRFMDIWCDYEGFLFERSQ